MYRFKIIENSSEDPFYTWVGRYGMYTCFDGGVVEWETDGEVKVVALVAEYLASYADHLEASDFFEVVTANARSTLLRQLYVFDSQDGKITKVAPPEEGRSFARLIEAWKGPTGHVFTNATADSPFEDAPTVDVSEPTFYSTIRCACAIIVAPAHIGLIEIQFDSVHET